MDIQKQLDDLLANNPQLQEHVTKLWYVPSGSPVPPDVTHTLSLASAKSIERHLLIGVVATPKTVLLLDTLLAMVATQ